MGAESAGEPRLLLIDMAPPEGEGRGALKQALLEDWREDALLHVHAGPKGQLLLSAGLEPARAVKTEDDRASALIAAFRPQVILYRPATEYPDLHDQFASQLLNDTDAPLVLWLTDELRGRLRSDDPYVLMARATSMNLDSEEGVKAPLAARASLIKSELARLASPPPQLGDEAPCGAKVQLDECRLVFEVLRARVRPGVMIDVGAHHGGALSPFLAAGWRIHAFEPDRKNRTVLEQSFGRNANIRISPKAVGASEASGVAFFSSDVSSGISSLSAFHESHVAAAAVEVTTLDAVIREAELSAVDFLKIDVEGHEMDVLDGLDFSNLRPRAIVAEFEDAKTRDRGVTMHDLAGRLGAAGYVVYVSEWWPVEQYGVTHSWRRLRAYPCEAGGEAWGNLIAFLEPPDEEAMRQAAFAAMRGGPAGAGARASVELAAGPAGSVSLYRRAATWLVRRHPRLAGILRGPARLILRAARGAGL